MNVTTGVPDFEGYNVHHFSQGEPVSSQPLSFRRAAIVPFCHSNLTSGSFSPATCSTGLGLRSPSVRAAAADDGAMAAKTSPRAAHSKYVKPPPLEWPVEYIRRSSTL